MGKMRPLSDQVVVITGASSGIGRETALSCGMRGASVVVAARNQTALEEVAAEIDRLGGRTEVVVTDVAEWPQLEALVKAAVGRFGRIDTWINNAAVSEYAVLQEMTPAEIERIIRVNLLGQLYGCKAALPYLQREGDAVLINVASALAKRAVPLQTAYSASKHGIKGFTEALRLELRRDWPNVHVCLALLSSINTPLFSNARSKVGRKPSPIPPIYEPSVVANALLALAEHPQDEITIGGAGKLLMVMERISPALLDFYMLQGNRAVRQQVSSDPDDADDNLFQASRGTGSSEGDFGERSKSESLYTEIFELHPKRKALLLIPAAVLLARLARPRSRS